MWWENVAALRRVPGNSSQMQAGQWGSTAMEDSAHLVVQRTEGPSWWTGLVERHCMEAGVSEVCFQLPRMRVRGSQAGTLEKRKRR